MSNHDLSTSTPWPAEALPEHWVESLFRKMAFTYGVKFADQWRGIDARGVKMHWAEALTVLTRDELAAGVRKLNTRDWPPTLPEFLKLCRPALDPQVAYYEALEQGARRQRGEVEAWSMPAIFWAWSAIGAHDFNQLGYAVLKARWERQLAAELAKEPQQPIPPRVEALPAPGRTRTADTEARSRLQQYGVQLAQAGATKAGRSTDWAERIMARSRAGQVLALASLEAAEAVLGINSKEAVCR